MRHMGIIGTSDKDHHVLFSGNREADMQLVCKSMVQWTTKLK